MYTCTFEEKHLHCLLWIIKRSSNQRGAPNRCTGLLRKIAEKSAGDTKMTKHGISNGKKRMTAIVNFFTCIKKKVLDLLY